MRLHKVEWRRIVKFFASKMPSVYLIALRMMQSDTRETRCYLRLVRKEMCVFDVGANNGYFTLLYSDLVGRHGRVHAFEPVPRSADQLRARMANDAAYDNVALNQVAVADVSGLELRIGIPNGDLGQASLVDHAEGSWRKGADIEYVQCRTITLDDYVARHDVKKVDFIKIDVEGAELSVLKGAEGILRAHRPIIHLEYFVEWTKGFGYSLKDLVSSLQAIGYDNFYDEDLREIEFQRSGAYDLKTWMNLVCSVGPLRPIWGQ